MIVFLQIDYRYMKSTKKIILICFLAFISSTTVFSQKFANEQEEINAKIEYANNLIWHFNYNIKAISNFQNELIIWFENPNRTEKLMPTYSYVSFSGNKIKVNESERSKKDMFNYNYHLHRLEIKILEFNLLCEKLENFRYNKYSEKNYTDNTFETANQIYSLSLELAEIAYDFSRSCAVNYKSENNQTQIKKLKNIVSQAKNMILALRENNEKLVREYDIMLEGALNDVTLNLNLRELFLVTKTTLSLQDLKEITDGIHSKAFNVAAWAEVYLQNEFSNDEINILLQEAISEFNEAEGKIGCASGFNTIITYSNTPLMYYVEEPNTIVAEKIIPVQKNTIEENTATNINQKETIEKVNSNTNTTIIEEEKFEAKNNNSLTGALPNNLIVLLDVSVSMKKSGKLPILKNTISHFLNIMRQEDKISLITYSGETNILVSGGSKNDRNKIIDTLSKVKSSGGSDIYNALKEAKKIGNDNFILNGNNKIIIASDGIFGVSSSVLNFTEQLRLDNYSLSVFQFSKEDEEVNLTSLKALANRGNGNYTVIYNSNDAINSMMKEIKKEAKNTK